MNNPATCRDPTAQPSAAFVICVEPGLLEYKALGLILTLRKYFGSWARVPIYAYSPRSGMEPSPWMWDVYARYNVTAVLEKLNQRFEDYPLANKPLAMSHAERTLDHEFLVFLDSDILCWRQPDGFELDPGKDLAMVVDSTKTIASAGPHDALDAMWMRLYAIADCRYEPYVETLLTAERVRGWWGTGVIAARRSAGLMEQWREVFEAAVDQSVFVPEADYLKEQASLCALAAAVHPRFSELPVGYNYPIQNHAHHRQRGAPPEDAVLWHYQPFLNKAFVTLRKHIDAAVNTDDKIAAAEKFISVVRHRYSSMIGLDEPVLKTMRRRLRLRSRLHQALERIGLRC